MTGSVPDAPEPDVMRIFDSMQDALACRVCGCLVPNDEDFAQLHWSWHEASNGA